MKGAKKMRWSGLILSLVLSVCFAITGAFVSLQKPTAQAEEAYNFGSATTQATRVEAEDYATNKGKLTANVNHHVSGTTVVEMGASWNDSSVLYTLNVPEAGRYVVKMCYWTGANGLKFSVVANKGTENEKTVESTGSEDNAWASTTTRGQRGQYVNAYGLELVAGENTIEIKQAATPEGYINLDFFEVYKDGAVYYYPNEKRTNPTDEHIGYIQVGERIEGEDFDQNGGGYAGTETYTCDVSYHNSDTLVSMSGGAMIEVNSFSIKTSVNIPEDGDYIVKFGYGTGSNVAGMGLNAAFVQGETTVNGTAPLKYHTSWLTGGGMETIYAQTQALTLKAGVQDLYVYQAKADASYYINLDFVEIYPANAVKYYPIEKNLYPELTGGWTVGDFMEAEYGIWVTGRTFVEFDTGNNISNRLYYSKNSTNNYNVTVPTAGKYMLEIVDCGNTAANNKTEVFEKKYTVVVGEKTYTFTDFNEGEYEYSSSSFIQTHNRFEIELEAGLNTLSITPTDSTHSKIDYYRILPASIELDTVVQAEDFMYGQVMYRNKQEADFPEITGCVTEFHKERPGRLILPVTVPVGQAGVYEMYVRAWSNSSNFMMSINGGDAQKYTTQNSGWLTSDVHSVKDNVYLIELQEGLNTLTLSRNFAEDKYVDLDWFYFTKHKLATNPNNGNGFKVKVGETLAFSSVNAKAEDASLVTLDGGNITGANVGSTKISYSYMAGNYEVVRTYDLTVEKGIYAGTDFEVPAKTVSYNGSNQVYSGATAPDGWTVAYSNNNGGVLPGTYTATVTFSHPNYEDVVKTGSLTIEKADYVGTELTAIDQQNGYTGAAIAYSNATAPNGWTITYDYDKTATLPGEYPVTVTFTHDGYNTVTKSAKLTIVKSDYSGTDLLAPDQSIAYDGQYHFYNAASAPAGWTIGYVENTETDGGINPGTYPVNVVFTHAGYNNVTKSATLTITKANFVEPDNTYFQFEANMQKTYNGELQTYSGATARDAAWTVAYVNNNGLTEPGSYEVTIVYSHDCYNNVEKTATFAIVKAVYTGTDLVFEDKTVTYSGAEHVLEATAPQGWTVTYTANALTNAGSLEVTATFAHACYENVEMMATLLVEKADYTGTDLIYEDLTVTENGMEQTIEASAPAGWTVVAIDGEQYAFIEPGTYVMTIKFTHANYNDVTLTATLTITEKKSGCGGSIVGGIGGLIAVLAAGAMICFKKKEQ